MVARESTPPSLTNKGAAMLSPRFLNFSLLTCVSVLALGGTQTHAQDTGNPITG
jgi:hypothetical protein